MILFITIIFLEAKRASRVFFIILFYFYFILGPAHSGWADGQVAG